MLILLSDCSRRLLSPLQVTLTGRFAFVEFRMPEYATAALQLNGQIALMGNTLKIARPSSYVEPSQVCWVYQGSVGVWRPCACAVLSGWWLLPVQSGVTAAPAGHSRILALTSALCTNSMSVTWLALLPADGLYL